MNKVLCLLYFDHMSGEFTSILDTYHNLIKYNIPCELLVISEQTKDLPILRKYLPLKININLKFPDTCQNYDTVICSAFFPFAIAWKKINNFFKCQKLIILDSSSFVMAELNNIPILDIINNFPAKDVYILGNNFNKKYFKKNYFHYYHKFDFNRLNKHSEIKKNEIFQKKKFYNPLDYKGMDYFRQIKVTFSPPITYYENIGKLIFEMKYLEREVNYSPKNKSFKDGDGLTDYLQQFQINDNLEQILQLSKSDIITNLGFHSNDTLLNLL